ncbi:MAG: hypothetical protein OXE84_10065 [Rhodobacteraceae bacterium]|nr:hypothetical protein [Paracoccaceae bacterium]MCY4326793.1 hypothetical protein [Paracoccaceae bacterium]
MTRTDDMIAVLKEAHAIGQVIKPPSILSRGVDPQARVIEQPVDLGRLVHRDSAAYRITAAGTDVLDRLNQPSIENPPIGLTCPIRTVIDPASAPPVEGSPSSNPVLDCAQRQHSPDIGFRWTIFWAQVCSLIYRVRVSLKLSRPSDRLMLES